MAREARDRAEARVVGIGELAHGMGKWHVHAIGLAACAAEAFKSKLLRVLFSKITPHGGINPFGSWQVP